MPASSRGPVVACAAYAGGCRVADVAIEDISEVLTQDDRFVWIGLYEPDEPLLKEVQAEFGLIPDDARPYFRDVYDHAIRLSEKVDGLRELLGTALEANLSLTTIAQNEATKRITGWAAIFAIPTMIAGIYGMNFEFMPELRWRWGHPVVMTVTVSLCGILYYRFKRSGWL